MERLRINTGAVKIEVNDEGETIILNFGDQSFPGRYYDMLSRVQEKISGMEEEAKALDQTATDQAIREKVTFTENICKYLVSEVDGLFGQETCRKVFGDIVPAPEYILEFLEALTPYFEKEVAKRQEKRAKYSASRTGNV